MKGAKGRILDRATQTTNLADRKIYRTSTVRDFLRLADDPSECGNYLDAPQFRGSKPWFIEYAISIYRCVYCMQLTLWGRECSDNITASTVTHKDGYHLIAEAENAVVEERVKKIKKNKKTAADQVRRELHEAAMKMQSGMVGLNATGPLVMDYDLAKLSHWDLVTMGGFYTYPHHDANGYCTWVSVRCGAKVWGIRRFRPSVVEQNNTAQAFIDMHEAIISADEHPVGMEHTDVDVYVIKPGSVLCVPYPFVIFLAH